MRGCADPCASEVYGIGLVDYAQPVDDADSGEASSTLCFLWFPGPARPPGTRFLEGSESRVGGHECVSEAGTSRKSATLEWFRDQVYRPVNISHFPKTLTGRVDDGLADARRAPPL